MNLCSIEKILAGHKPAIITDDLPTPAAVALLLREEASGPEMLFIERAAHDNDPWSGNISFPGGKIEKDDVGPQLAAERETLEEIGLDLRDERYLGRLSDVVGAHLPVKISCFVYATAQTGPFSLNEEVRDLFWVPVEELLDPARHGEFSVSFSGQTFIRPAIRLPQEGKPLLWGITYRLVMDFLELLQRDGR
ncbi:MAG: CoA pyrophosphatase [Deltaproteobacteria bacterium]